MDTIGIIGFVVSLLAVAIYIIGAVLSAPKLLIRLANAENLHVRLRNPVGKWGIGISTTRTNPIILNECIVEHDCEHLMFVSQGLFEPVSIGRGIGLSWRGNERLERNQFVLLSLNYSSTGTVIEVPIAVSLICSIPSDAWRFPWSMYSAQPKKRTYHFLFTISPEAEQETNIRIGPGEGARMIGPAAKNPIKLSGAEDVTVTEINEDGTYTVHRIKKDNP